MIGGYYLRLSRCTEVVPGLNSTAAGFGDEPRNLTPVRALTLRFCTYSISLSPNAYFLKAWIGFLSSLAFLYSVPSLVASENKSLERNAIRILVEKKSWKGEKEKKGKRVRMVSANCSLQNGMWTWLGTRKDIKFPSCDEGEKEGGGGGGRYVYVNPISRLLEYLQQAWELAGGGWYSFSPRKVSAQLLLRKLANMRSHKFLLWQPRKSAPFLLQYYVSVVRSMAGNRIRETFGVNVCKRRKKRLLILGAQRGDETSTAAWKSEWQQSPEKEVSIKIHK